MREKLLAVAKRLREVSTTGVYRESAVALNMVAEAIEIELAPEAGRYELQSEKQEAAGLEAFDGSFSGALDLIKMSYRLSRRGWNGKNMCVFLVQGSKFEVNRAPLNQFFPDGTPIEYRPHIDMIHADGSVGVWYAVQNDLLADDWFVVE